MSKWSPTWSQCIIDSATGFPPVHPHSFWRSGTQRFASAVRSSGFGYSDFRFELSFRAREAMSGSLVQRRIFSTRSDQSPGRSAAVITPLSNSLGLLGVRIRCNSGAWARKTFDHNGTLDLNLSGLSGKSDDDSSATMLRTGEIF